MADREPALRAILLGASNLKAGLPIVLEGIRRRAAGPVEVLAACGHGRSYGAWSRFLFVRRLPGIAGSGLWQALEEGPPRRTLALVTDIGNDLIYGAGIERIAAWIETCLERLSRHQAQVLLTLLPVHRLERLSLREARLASALLFPGRSSPWPALLEQARSLNERLRRLGQQCGARLVEPAAHWYGIDPIHLRSSLRETAWEHILSLWRPSPGAAQRSAAGRIRIPLFGTAELRLFGITRRNPQPAVRLADGTTIALY